MIKKIYLFLYISNNGKYYENFEEMLKDNDINEEEFWKIFEDENGNIENSSMIEFIKSIKEIITNINNYIVFNPNEEIDNTYIALENGIYTFKIKEISTGKEYTKSVEVANVDNEMEFYNVYGETGLVGLLGANKEATYFEKAYLIYKEERIDITSCIEDVMNCNSISILNMVSYLENIGEIEDRNDLGGTTQKFELVKDGRSYFGDIVLEWYQ